MSLLTTPMTAEDIVFEKAKLSVDLSFLFDKTQIPPEVQAKFAALGYTDIMVFAQAEETGPLLREMIKKDVGLNPDTSSDHRNAVARVVAAWKAAAKHTDRRDTEEAEQRVSDLPRTLKKGSHLELRRTFEKLYGELNVSKVPAPAYVEAKMEQVEDGELRAERLCEVLNLQDHKEEHGALKIQSDGTIKLQKSRVTGTMPAKPEELRKTFKIMGTCWEFTRLTFPAKDYLVDYAPSIWDEHIEWLLGDDVYENTIKGPTGEEIYRPSWQILLEYDYQVRQRACHEVNISGMTLAKALKDARQHAPTERKYLSLPVSLAAASHASRSGGSRARSRSPRRERPHDGSTEHPPHAGGKGGGKSGSKGGGGKSSSKSSGKGGGKSGSKGGSKGGKQREHSDETWETPDGRAKCFKYNVGTCKGKCGRVHTCLACNGSHPKTECTRLR
jgi:uncharacterized membrane protein YgcG